MNHLQPEQVACNLCGADAPKLLFAAPQFSARKLGIVRCRTCGLVYRNVRQAATDLRRNYAQWDAANLAPERLACRKKIFGESLKLLAPFRRTNRVLDVGAGHGFFLRACAERGWDCYGVEISRPAVDFAQRNFGLSFTCGSFEEAGYPDEFFDAVTFLNVLEFLPNPKGALQKTHRLLRPGGAVLVRFSNAVFHVAAYRFFLFLGRIHRKLNRVDRAVIHLYAFDKNSIRRLLLESGFNKIKVACMPLSWMTKNDVQTGLAEQLACQLLHPLACFFSFVSFRNLLISPSLAAMARKD